MKNNLNTDYTIEDTLFKFYEDKNLFLELKKWSLIAGKEEYTTEDKINLEGVAELLHRNRATIANEPIQELLEDRFLNQAENTSGATLGFLFGFKSLPETVVHRLFYLFKYGTIKTFFQKNYKTFLPDYDIDEISSRPKAKIFLESFMIEFDKFSKIIDDLYNLVDIDKAPVEYLDYLAQLIGYEKDENIILEADFFREFLKNIVEIYKIKGTNYSFELFMNFVGFDVELEEFFFDRRYYYSNASINEFTGEGNRNRYGFYLTTQNPEDGYLKESSVKENVTKKDFTPLLSLHEFSRMASENSSNILKLLGYDEDWDGPVYKYFKTNVITYKISRVKTKITDVVGGITEEEFKLIAKYIDFLTPIFIMKNFVFVVPPASDDYTEDLFKLLKDELENARKMRAGELLQNNFDDLGYGYPSYTDSQSVLEPHCMKGYEERPFYPRPNDFGIGDPGNSTHFKLHFSGYFPRQDKTYRSGRFFNAITGMWYYDFGLLENERINVFYERKLNTEDTYEKKNRTIKEIFGLRNLVPGTSTKINAQTGLFCFTRISENEFHSFAFKDNFIPETRYLYDGVFVWWKKTNPARNWGADRVIYGYSL